MTESSDTFAGLKIEISKYLPKTVHDKDGNEVELLGVMMPDDFGILMDMEPEQAARRMVLITGEVVEKKE